MKLKNLFVLTLILTLMVSVLLVGEILLSETPAKEQGFHRFQSGEQLVKAFEEARKTSFLEGAAGIFRGMGSVKMLAAETSTASGRDYSTTNIQVEGVDEADVIKTDGEYIYLLAQGKLIIAKAYPAEQAEIIASLKLDNFEPQELFIHQDRLLLFGSSSSLPSSAGKPAEFPGSRFPSSRRFRTTSLRLYDTSDKENPELLRTLDFEGDYLTSRKIEENVYFVFNTYPRFSQEEPSPEDIIPVYKDDDKKDQEQDGFEPVAEPGEIGYVENVPARNFITVAAVSMTDEDKELNKEVIAGEGQNVYASLQNVYIAQTTYPSSLGELTKSLSEKTTITKFALKKGEITFLAAGEVKGRILNQFSMDEYETSFRIATTIGDVWDKDKKSSNNVYILDEELKVAGELEELAPGERIYSVRFMGKRGYVVTFKKVDPLFVIDLENPNNPQVLGKLKIPGYSDYLHPYDENHIIGIGKDTVEAEEELKQGRGIDFAWYQGVKMAVFDVSDVENPKELHKVVIGERGTESEALRDHKAFLFDQERNLLVIPITLMEIKGERTSPTQYGEYTFQGAYVYDLTLEEGFKLRGRVTHYDDEQAFKKSGFYFGGEASIRRSLYIEEVLYTLSDSRLQLNALDSLERLKILEFW